MAKSTTAIEQTRQKPIIIKDNETGEPRYTLEFNRKSVRAAEQANFNISELGKFPLTNSQLLFYFAFRMHHKGVQKDTTDEILAELGGIQNEALFSALIKLYDQAMTSLNDGDEKNARFTLDL